MRQQFIEAGEIVTTHGVRGEVKLLPWLDSAEQLLPMTRCRIEGREYGISAVRVSKGCALVKLAGVDSMEAAQALRGKTATLYREDFPPELVFASELTGVEVYSQDGPIGRVAEVLDYPGNKVYVVRDGGGKEYLIPAVRAFVRRIDLDGNRMDVSTIEGMETDAD